MHVAKMEFKENEIRLMSGNRYEKKKNMSMVFYKKQKKKKILQKRHLKGKCIY